nr:efflux pump fus6 [Quercus suber]
MSTLVAQQWITRLTLLVHSQGLGGGGVALMINIILTDLVPLRERGKYMGIVQMVSAVRAALGPFLGGLLTSNSSWRWVFYINLPIGGGEFRISVSCCSLVPCTNMGVASLVALFFFLRVAKPAPTRLSYKISRIDFAGNAIFIASTVAAIKGRTSFWSGVDTLPLFAGIFPFAILGGIFLAKFGRYKPMHLTGMAVITLSFGLFSLLDQSSSTAAWACFQLLFATGAGLMIAILLPAMQAPLPETLVALSTGVWTFVRGFVWYVGVAFAGFGWLLIWIEREVTLQSKLNTKFGLEEKKRAAQTEDLEHGTTARSNESVTKNRSGDTYTGTSHCRQHSAGVHSLPVVDAMTADCLVQKTWVYIGCLQVFYHDTPGSQNPPIQPNCSTQDPAEEAKSCSVGVLAAGCKEVDKTGQKI